jgi:AcrR family transcriptional regulator
MIVNSRRIDYVAGVSKQDSARRTRRTAEDARTQILDAAERRLVGSGMKGIRLQDVAADVGISHPTVLHHFGSRERLVNAVIKRRIAAMMQDVTDALAGAAPDERSAVALFERLFKAFGPGGNARVAAFLALEGPVPGVEPESLLGLAQLAHSARIAKLGQGQASPPAFEDTLFTVLLSAFALVGEAILGPMFRGEPDEHPDLAASERFREWTARLVFAHASKAPEGPEPRVRGARGS